MPVNPLPADTADPDRIVARRSMTLVAVALLSLGTVACSADAEPASPVVDAAPAPVAGDAVQTGLGDVAALSADEIAGLLWMREEEQLAHDVYATLGDLWGLRVFENIAASEQTHVDAVVRVLDLHRIDDPAAGNEPGTFTDPQIQRLFDELVADGRTSLVAALEVGALIEELDIADLRQRASATDDDALTSLYDQLEKGSRNHLRAFTSQLEARGVVHEPVHLTADQYEAIVSTPTERGRDS
jgi:hypothetical protein